MLGVMVIALLSVQGPQMGDVAQKEQAGDDRGALQIADTLVHSYPDWVLPRIEAARLRIKIDSELDVAARDLKAAEKLTPDNPRIFYLEGLLAQQQGKTDEAIAALKKALDLRSDYDDARTKLAGLCFETRDWACAEQQYRAMADADPRPGTRLQLAATLEQMGRTDDAIRELKIVLAEQPDQPVAKRRLADLYEKTGQKKLAAKLRAGDPAPKKMRPLKKSKH